MLGTRVGSRSKLKQHVFIKVVPFCIKMNVSFIKIIYFFVRLFKLRSSPAGWAEHELRSALLAGDLLSLKSHTKERKI